MTTQTVNEEALANLLKNSEASLRSEEQEYGRFGPAFTGDFDELDAPALCLGTLTVLGEVLIDQHKRYCQDFQQLFSILALAEDCDTARKLEKTARDAYDRAEQRLKAQARALSLIGKRFHHPSFSKNLEQALSFPWDKIEQIQEHVREASKQQAQAEAAADQEGAKVAEALDRLRSAVNPTADSVRCGEEGAPGACETDGRGGDEEAHSGGASSD